MAGHRRADGRPRKAVARVESRSSRLGSKIGAEPTWRQRIGPATDHVRAGLARLARTDQRAAEALAEALVHELRRIAADLDSEQKRMVR